MRGSLIVWSFVVLVLACAALQPAMAEAPRRDIINGYWRGHFVHEGRQTPLSATFVTYPDRIEGRFSEQAYPADPDRPRFFSTLVDGRFDGANVSFTKRYDSFAGQRHEARFTGVIEPLYRTMSGTWTGRRDSGTFFLDWIPAPSDPINSRHVSSYLGEIERSTYNRLLPVFSDLYWSFTPKLPSTFKPSGRLPARVSAENSREISAFLTDAIALNRPALEAHVAAACARLSPAQTAFLRDWAKDRYRAMRMRLGARRQSIETAVATLALGKTVGRLPPLSFSNTCGQGAASGGGTVSVGDDVVVSAILGAMFVDTFSVSVTPRALRDGEQLRVTTSPDSRTPENLSELLFRLRATPFWNDLMRREQFLAGRQRQTLMDFEAAYFADQCPGALLACWFETAYVATVYPLLNFEVFLNDQIDFTLAHELGHYALGHHDVPIGACAQERRMERDADFFAVALIRPDTGLFTDSRVPVTGRETDRYYSGMFGRSTAPISSGGRVDQRYASGVEVFLTQSYRLAGLRGGDDCRYDSMTDRIAAAKAFESRSFPPVAASR